LVVPTEPYCNTNASKKASRHAHAVNRDKSLSSHLSRAAHAVDGRKERNIGAAASTAQDKLAFINGVVMVHDGVHWMEKGCGEMNTACVVVDVGGESK
jgi:hypothetical protein